MIIYAFTIVVVINQVVLLFAPKFTRGFKTWGTVASIPPSGGVTVEFEPDTYVCDCVCVSVCLSVCVCVIA